MDMGYSGSDFTWCNNRKGKARIYKRLDRGLVNQAWIDKSICTSIIHLARVSSDHSPLLMEVTHMTPPRYKPFRFLNFWVNRSDFFQVVEMAWESNADVNPLYNVSKKLKAVKTALREWSKNKVGNIFISLEEAEKDVITLEEELEKNSAEETFIRLNQAKAKLVFISENVKEFQRQKARLKWIAEGDANTKFFHSCVKQKRQKLRLIRIRKEDNTWVEDKAEIAKMGEDFFANLFEEELLFHSMYCTNLKTELKVIPKVLMEDDNRVLQEVPLQEEIRSTVFKIDGDSAPGPDGFSGLFFQKCWDIICLDITKAVQVFSLDKIFLKGTQP